MSDQRAQQAQILERMARMYREYPYGLATHQHEADALDAGAQALRQPAPSQQVAPDDHLDIYAPGEWRCPQCNFFLSKMTLNVRDGDVGVSAHDVYHGEPCPNDGTPMVKVTWRERASDNYSAYVKLVNDICAAAQAEHLPGALEKITAQQPTAVVIEATQHHRDEIDRLTQRITAVASASPEPPTCEHCGLPLTCASERAELIHGLEQMHAETLTRAEAAEAQLAAVAVDRQHEQDTITARKVVEALPLDAIQSAAGLCASEGHKWEHVHSKTGEHWRHVAAHLNALDLCIAAWRDQLPAAPPPAVDRPREQEPQ